VFCAVAALVILGQAHRIDLEALDFWLAHRQLPMEQGFAGRCNKLVDGCYSFWQGGTCALLEHWRHSHHHHHQHGDSSSPVATRGGADAGGSVGSSGRSAFPPPGSLNRGRRFNAEGLQRYILMCAQQYPDGGLRDKPSKPRDFYHTCYNLAGLSVAQHPPTANRSAEPPLVWGCPSNLVAEVHPVYNIRASAASAALVHFGSGSYACDHGSLQAAYRAKQQQQQQPQPLLRTPVEDPVVNST